MTRLTLLSIIAGLGLCRAEAELLLYEPFDYIVTNNLSAQVTAGFVDNSTWTHDGEPEAVGVPGGSIHFDGLAVAGNRLSIQEATNSTLRMTRPTTFAADGQAIYLSCLVTLEHHADQAAFSRMLSLQTTNGRWDVSAKQAGTSRSSIARDGTAQESGDWTPELNTPYLVVAAFVGQTQSLWILTADELAAVRARGLDTTALNSEVDAARQAHGNHPSAPPAILADDPQAMLLLDLGDSDGQNDQQVGLDELRIGTTLADVIPAPRMLPAASGPPNVIIILADDMGWGDTRINNPASKILTPNIDQLARQGCRFTDAHSPSSVCSPTRFALLTGFYGWRSRLKRWVIVDYDAPLIEPAHVTLPELLLQQGYRTACYGKWHLGMRWTPKPGSRGYVNNRIAESDVDFSQPLVGGPLTAGFETYFGHAAPNLPPYIYIEDDHIVGPAPTQPKPPEVSGFPGLMQNGWALAEVMPTITRRTMTYLDEQLKTPEPLFLYCPLNAPHTPILPVHPYIGQSEAGPYGDFVAQVDGFVGEVLRVVAANQAEENTLIIFSSDNGSPGYAGGDPAGPLGVIGATFGHFPSAHFRGLKTDIHEGGHRVPLIFTWPGRIEPSVTDEPVCLVDLFTTLARVLQVPVGPNVAGDSWNIWPAVTGNFVPPLRGPIVHHSIYGMFSLREGDQKLIMGTGSGGWSGPHGSITPLSNPGPGQFYYLASDPSETTDLFDENDPDVIRMRTTLLDYWNGSGSTDPNSLVDTDNDTLPDSWEIQYALDPLDERDAASDPDNDQLVNTNEFRLDTNPRLADSDGDRLHDNLEDANLNGIVEASESNPALADSDNDGHDDFLEVLAGSDPRDDQSTPPIITHEAPVTRFIRVGVDGNESNTAEQGDWDPSGFATDTAAPYYIREMDPLGSPPSVRTRLFLQFDTSGIQDPISARLRVHQWHKKHGVAGQRFNSNIDVGRVLNPWDTTAGSFPLYDSPVASERSIGNSDDFGFPATSSGFYSGVPHVATGDIGVDVLDLVAGWWDNSHPNHGLRLRLRTPSFSAVALSANDDPSTPNENEALGLVLTAFAPGALTALERWQWETSGAGPFPGTNYDGDPYPDLAEFALGLDPTHAESMAALQLREGPNGLELFYQRPPDGNGVNIVLESVTDLVAAAWQDAGMAPTIQALGGNREEVTYEMGPGERTRFYRLGFSQP